MVKNGCDQSGDRTLKLTVSEEPTVGKTDFLHTDANSQKLNADQKFFGWAWLKMGVVSLIMGTNGINFFFHAGTNSGKRKVDLMFSLWMWSKKPCCILRMNL